MAEKEDVVWKTYLEIDFLQANQFGEVRTIDHYTVRKDGRKQFVKGHVLKQQLYKNGYLYVDIYINGKHIHLRVHRIIATCFLPNPDNLPQVNHKDCNPKNNSVSNLEFCTSQYNMTYKEKYGISSAEAVGKPVFAVSLETFKVFHFETRSEAARQLGVGVGNINAVLKGRCKQIGGYWFTEDESEITKEKIQEIKDSVSKGVFAVNLKTSEVSRFESQHEAARQLGSYASNINKVLRGQYKQTGGYWFCYADSNAVEKTRIKFGDKVADEVEKIINQL